MKQLTCEVCGAHEIRKQDDIFVCQSCGCQYTDATKLLIEIDDSKEQNNLYILARRAKESMNISDAENYYKQLVVKNPNDWESVFYSVYFTSANCKIAQIDIATKNLTSVIPQTFELIKNNLSPNEHEAAYSEVATKTIFFANSFFNTALDYADKYKSVSGTGEEFSNNMINLEFLLIGLANNLHKYFNEKDIAISSLGTLLTFNDKCKEKLGFPLFKDTRIVMNLALKIEPNIESSEKYTKQLGRQIGPYHVSAEEYNEIMSLLHSGEKIKAIKMLMATAGIGLGDAKEAIDNL